MLKLLFLEQLVHIVSHMRVDLQATQQEVLCDFTGYLLVDFLRNVLLIQFLQIREDVAESYKKSLKQAKNTYYEKFLEDELWKVFPVNISKTTHPTDQMSAE